MTEIQFNADNSTAQFNLALIKNIKSVGIFMIVIGVIGILVPNVIGLALNTLVGSLFLLAAFALAFNAWQYKAKDISQWFKPFILFALSLIIFFHPAIILSVLGLLIALYFLISGFGSIAIAFQFNSGARIWSILSGIISFSLGFVVLTNWPFGSAWIIGLIIGVTFLFDGIALLSITKELKKNIK